jgi:hypothetical protein
MSGLELVLLSLAVLDVARCAPAVPAYGAYMCSLGDEPDGIPRGTLMP